MSQNFPKHIAIIPDGNRRWARQRGLNPWEGHYEGAQRFEELVDLAFDKGVNSISFWGSSVDNLTKRPLKEKIALLDIYEKYFQKLITNKRIFTDEVKIGIFGRWAEQFPKKLVKLLQEGIEKTRKHSQFKLNFLLAYNGDDDLLEATKNIIKKKISVDKITNDIIQKNLLTAEIPSIDLVIRTGVEGDPHNSAGFLMWQTQNSQFHFTEDKFPDFTADKFKIALDDFSRRLRRLGE